MDNKKLQTFLRFLEQDPFNLNLLLTISDAYRQQGDLKSAQDFLDKAKTIDCGACFSHQGFIHIHLGQFKLAKEELEKALAREDSPMIRYSLALCHYSLQESNEGIALLQPLLEKGSSTDEIELLLAKLLRQQNRLNEAIKLLEERLKNRGPSADFLALLAEIYFDRQEFELAQNTARQALLHNPENYEAQVILLLLLLSEGETTVVEIEALLKRKPDNAYLWFALGTTFMHKVQLQNAEVSFLKASELAPLFLDNWISLGWCQLCLDKLQQAKASYQQAIKIDEQSAEAWAGMALVLSLNDEFEEAEQLITKARHLNPLCLLADIAEMIQANQSNPLQALELFRKTFPSIALQISKVLDRVWAEKNSILH